jgi:hypothetical protein
VIGLSDVTGNVQAARTKVVTRSATLVVNARRVASTGTVLIASSW